MYLKKINLKNKIALVTGAGKGIGKACAIALAEAGANLIIISRTKKDLNKVSKIIRKLLYHYKLILWQLPVLLLTLTKQSIYICSILNIQE